MEKAHPWGSTMTVFSQRGGLTWSNTRRKEDLPHPPLISTGVLGSKTEVDFEVSKNWIQYITVIMSFLSNNKRNGMHKREIRIAQHLKKGLKIFKIFVEIKLIDRKG